MPSVSAVTRVFRRFWLTDFMKRWLVVAVVCSALSAHAQTQFVPSDLRAGEAVNGFPKWEERVIHEWINRARVDPQLEMTKCGAACLEKACYAPIGPLGWGEALNHSARYHAAEMTKQNYFGHDSQCTIVPNINALYPAGCDGAASCGCVGGSLKCTGSGCTSWRAASRCSAPDRRRDHRVAVRSEPGVLPLAVRGRVQQRVRVQHGERTSLSHPHC